MVDAGVELPALYESCDAHGCSGLDAGATQALVMPRVRADVWLTRHLTVGVSYGHAIVGSGDVVALNINGHIGRRTTATRTGRVYWIGRSQTT